MTNQEFDYNQLQEDVEQIKAIAAEHDGDRTQIWRIQHIVMAAGYCLQRLMGPAAAAHWLHGYADQVAKQTKQNVH